MFISFVKVFGSMEAAIWHAQLDGMQLDYKRLLHEKAQPSAEGLG
jgi:hypothetical protein